jgi:L-ascorbate metabolism protein UlaG (beta-lactamase superfamily)
MEGQLGFSFTWYGHSCLALTNAAGTRLLVDPWFGNPLSTLAVDAVEGCDVLLVTHGHFDHLGCAPGGAADADAIRIARRHRPTWPCIHEMSLWLETIADLGAEVVGMNKGGTVTPHGVAVAMVHADHSAGDWDAGKGSLSLGEPVGFVVELEPGGPRIYLAGDTDVFGDMALIGELHRPDVAFLPIGGHFTMDPRAAAHAVRLLGVSSVVPIHYGTFPILAGTPEALRAELSAIGLERVTVLAPVVGEEVS